MEHFVIVTEEIWRDIEGYEGLYEVSNLGRVKSLERIDRHNHLVKERILKPAMYVGGYLSVSLCKEGKIKNHLVHRLVGKAFIPNPEEFPVINHLDQNPKNNQADNLEWCTQKHNVNWSDATERQLQTKISKGLYDPEMCGVIKNKGEKEYKHLYYQKNKERLSEQKKEHYQNNREKIREHRRELYQKNREKIIERSREYYQKNRDQINSRRRKKQTVKDSSESLW